MNIRKIVWSGVGIGTCAVLLTLMSWKVLLTTMALVGLCAYLLAQDSRNRTETESLVPRGDRRSPPQP